MTQDVLTEMEYRSAADLEFMAAAVRQGIDCLLGSGMDAAARAIRQMQEEWAALRADRDRFRDLYRAADRVARACALMEDAERVATLRAEHQAMTVELHRLRSQRDAAAGAIEEVLGSLRVGS